MIPAQIDDAVSSSAERRVFHLLGADPDTNGWIVLHSLGLARRRTGPYGEIDFVIIVPREGIICLEIKAGACPVKMAYGGLWIDRDVPRC